MSTNIFAGSYKPVSMIAGALAVTDQNSVWRSKISNTLNVAQPYGMSCPLIKHYISLACIQRALPGRIGTVSEGISKTWLDSQTLEEAAGLKYHIGLIGPGKLLAQVVKKMISFSENPANVVVGVCSSDRTVPDVEVPVFKNWRDLIRDCQLDFLVLLSDDQGLKQDIRRNLPLDVDLVEEVPGKSGIVNIIAKAVFRKKLGKKVRFLESLVEALPFPAITFNRFGVVTHWNSSCENMTKVRATSVVGKKRVGRSFYYTERPLIGQMLLSNLSLNSYREYFPDHDLDIVVKDDSVMVRGFMNLKGSLQGYYHVTSQKIFMDGRLIGAIQLIQDVNALTLLQEEASQKQAALHSIVNHLPFPVFQTRTDGTVLFINRAGIDLFREISDSTGLKENIFSMCPEIRDEFSHFIKTLSQDHDPSGNQERRLSRTVYWNNASWDVNCFNPAGQKHELVWIIRNISMKEKESQLSTALAMVGTICHEFSQPLTAIINSSQLLSRTKSSDQERIQRHLRIIDEQGERVFEIYRKLQNITQVRLQKYLDTQILDLEESTDEMGFEKKNTEK